MVENKEISQKLKDFYKGKYFIGQLGKKDQFLHFNKKGFELRTGITGDKIVIWHEDNEDQARRFEGIKNSPMKFCYKIDCLEYLHNHTKDAAWWQLLTQKIIEHGRTIKG